MQDAGVSIALVGRQVVFFLVHRDVEFGFAGEQSRDGTTDTATADHDDVVG
jgi:hypothetical protein